MSPFIALLSAMCTLGNAQPGESDQSASQSCAPIVERWVHITGHAVDQHGHPVAAARVTRLGPGGGDAVTDELGAFSLFLRHEGVESLNLAFEKRTSSATLHATARMECRPDTGRIEVGLVELRGVCSPAWTADLFGGPPGTFGQVNALAVFDDGSGAGPALYVGGSFLSAGGVAASRIAKWDGSSWSALGAGVNGSVWSLAVFDDGSGDGPALYVGGQFITAGTASARRIAKWNGLAWSAVGSGITGAGSPTVFAMTVFDDGAGGGPALYAGGDFTFAGGQSANRIAKWDGASWSSLGTGMNNEVRALSTFDDGTGDGPALYVGGAFTTAGGAPANYIAKWNGSSWLTLGTGMNFNVYALSVFDDGSGADPALYVGGGFWTAGGASANKIAKWDGSSWTALGAGLSGGSLPVVTSLTAFDDGSGAGPVLVAAGGFAFAGGIEAGGIASWNGSAWSALGSGIGQQPIYALTAFDSGGGASLFAGGAFASIGGVNVSHVGKWNGTRWSALGNGLNGSVLALTAMNSDSRASPALYAGGQFQTAGGGPVSFIAQWDGTTWSALGTGMDHSVAALATFDDGSGAGPALYAGGSFTTAGGVEASRIAKWDGAAWTPLGAGMDGDVFALTVFDDGSGEGSALYAGGSFTAAGDEPANNIARWNGSSWSPLEMGRFSSVYALAIFDDGTVGGPALYAGGGGVAKWNGSTWSGVGSGVNGTVRALVVFDDGLGNGPALYAGGDFIATGDGPANNIAKWNGSSWVPLGAGTSSPVRTLAAFDDGIGAALYAGGLFTTAGADTVRHIARWNGSVWSALSTGMSGTAGDPQVNALTVFDDGYGGGPALYAGGGFVMAGGAISSRIARWTGCAAVPTPCPGDANSDNAINFDDITEVIANWTAVYSPDSGPGDANHDGVVDSNDLNTVLANWGAACP